VKSASWGNAPQAGYRLRDYLENKGIPPASGELEDLIRGIDAIWLSPGVHTIPPRGGSLPVNAQRRRLFLRTLPCTVLRSFRRSLHGYSVSPMLTTRYLRKTAHSSFEIYIRDNAAFTASFNRSDMLVLVLDGLQ
jgi:hypothetical protein